MRSIGRRNVMDYDEEYGCWEDSEDPTDSSDEEWDD